MNIIKLQNDWEQDVDKHYKYKELCILLGEEEKSRGKSRDYQLQDWKRYFDFYKPNPKGQKYIITEIYDTPKEKADNRGKNENSHHNQSEGEFTPILQKLLKSYLRYAYTQQDDRHVLYTTNNQLGKILGFFNTDYQFAISNKINLINVMKVMSYQKIYNHRSIYDFIEFSENYKNHIRYQLQKLEKEGKIEFCYDYIITFVDKTEYTITEEGMKIYKSECRVPYPDEMAAIEQIQIDILEELKVDNFLQLKYKNLLNKYYRMFDERVVKEIEYCDSCFKGYKIKMLDNFIEDDKRDLLPTQKMELQNKINGLFCNSIMNQGERKKNKFLDEIKDVWGELSPDMKKREYVTSDFYKSDLKYLGRYLLNLTNRFHIENLIKENMKELEENAKLIKELGWDNK